MVSKGVFNVRGEGISRFIGIASSAPVFDSVKHGCNSHQQSGHKSAFRRWERSSTELGTGGTTVAPAWIQHLKPWRSLGRGIRRPKSKVWGPTWISPAPRLTVIHIQSSSRLHCVPRSMSIHVSIHNFPNLFCHVGLVSRCLGRCIGVFRSCLKMLKLAATFLMVERRRRLSPDCMSNWDVSSFWSLTCIPVRKWL